MQKFYKFKVMQFSNGNNIELGFVTTEIIGQ